MKASIASLFKKRELSRQLRFVVWIVTGLAKIANCQCRKLSTGAEDECNEKRKRVSEAWTSLPRLANHAIVLSGLESCAVEKNKLYYGDNLEVLRQHIQG